MITQFVAYFLLNGFNKAICKLYVISLLIRLYEPICTLWAFKLIYY